jgi:hypothetical protein
VSDTTTTWCPDTTKQKNSRICTTIQSQCCCMHIFTQAIYASYSHFTYTCYSHTYIRHTYRSSAPSPFALLAPQLLDPIADDAAVYDATLPTLPHPVRTMLGSYLCHFLNEITNCGCTMISGVKKFANNPVPVFVKTPLQFERYKFLARSFSQGCERSKRAFARTCISVCCWVQIGTQIASL